MRCSKAIVLIMITGMLTVTACDRGGEPSVAEKAVAAAARGIDHASSERTQNLLEQLRMALDRYAADNNGYPAGSSLGAIAEDLSPYLKPLRETDAWGNALSYSSDGRSYTIVSPGQDGRAGTQDDLVLSDGAISSGAR